MESETARQDTNRNGGDEAHHEESERVKGNTNGQPERKEGGVTKLIENYTSKIPSGAFLTAAVGAIAVSAAFQMTGAKHKSQFVGHWVPTILILGLYNKLVKLEGSEG